MNFKTILSSRDTSINTRKCIVKCYVWATFLCGSETWTIPKSIAKKINAFEMWIYRRMLIIIIIRIFIQELTLQHVMLLSTCVLIKLNGKPNLLKNKKKKKNTVNTVDSTQVKQ